MGAQVSKWIRDREASGGWAQDTAVELRLAHVLALLRKRRGTRARKTRTVATGEGAVAPPLRATDVVTEDTIKELRDARREDEAIYVPYLRRAAQSEPVVETMEVKIGTHEYRMPRVTLPCAATIEELEAMNGWYISYGMMGGRRRLLERQKAALADVGGLDQDRFIVDGSGYGAMVYIHDAFSDAGLRGKRALLLLNAEMGIDHGYMKKCFGSSVGDGERKRNDLKSANKVHAGPLTLPTSRRLRCALRPLRLHVTSRLVHAEL